MFFIRYFIILHRLEISFIGDKSPLFCYTLMISRDKIIELAGPVLNEKKFFIVSLTISASNKIVLHIDGMKGVKIEDCIHVSRVIEQGLDREVEDFDLEVSSAGLDTPFKSVQQYVKNIGRDVIVQHSNGSITEGKLIEANENNFVIECRRREKIEGKKKKQTIIERMGFDYNEVNNVKLVLRF